MEPIFLPNPISDHPLNQGRSHWWLTVPGLEAAGLPSFSNKVIWLDIVGSAHGQFLDGTPAIKRFYGTGRQGGFGHTDWQNNNRISLPTTYATGSAFTVSFWIRLNSTPGSTAGIIGLNAGTTFIGISNDPKIDFVQSSTDFKDSTTLTANKWYHINISVSGGTASYYVNGILSSTTTGPGSLSYDSLGELGFGGFLGQLDDISIWNNRALSATDAQALYEDSRMGYPFTLNRGPQSSYVYLMPSNKRLVFQRGSSHWINSFTERQLGSFSVEATSVMRFQRGTYKVSNSLLETQRGSYGLINTHCFPRKLGKYNVRNSVTNGQLGSYQYAIPIVVSQRGTYLITTSFRSKQWGSYGIRDTTFNGRYGYYRVQNLSKRGFNVYVGSGVLPDLTIAPTAFSSTLPILIPNPPPVFGQQTYYVVVREQDSYGVESQNQQPLTITIDNNANTILPVLNPPVALLSIPQPSTAIRVLAKYPTLAQDQYPADKWKVWINTAPPDPTVDIPTEIVNVAAGSFLSNIGSYASGTYYVAVALYRTADGQQSAAISGTIVVPAVPSAPLPVHSGHQIPNYT